MILFKLYDDSIVTKEGLYLSFIQLQGLMKHYELYEKSMVVEFIEVN